MRSRRLWSLIETGQSGVSPGSGVSTNDECVTVAPGESGVAVATPAPIPPSAITATVMAMALLDSVIKIPFLGTRLGLPGRLQDPDA